MKTAKKMTRIVHYRYAVILIAVIALTSLSLAVPRQLNTKMFPMTGRDKWQQPARVVADLGLKEGSTVADVGCGSGYFTFRLSKAVGEKGKVFATEISDKGLKAVADRAKKNNITNIQTVKSDPTRTKLGRHSVDAATIINVLHHVPKEYRIPLVKDIAEAIKPDGSFYIIEWRVKANIKHDKNRRIPRADLVRLAEGAGLKLDAEFFYLENQVFLRFNKPVKK
ncbi:MAG: class I SAM-dependent methyltransferase [Phycisphaerae bacterium]|jgi:ubiquinone/menaquinone biosynthesis C-methylase UbiE|nr:class I SAM-dependent methyltransferase [Phycisphaerae bacterium]